ncbi:MAG: response regulator, partial [Anaerolineaceae bacterium]|nr:response regulator [Anaerolineaceae bacterium]
EAGKLTLEAIDFEPLEMIETAVQMFTPKAQEKSLSLMAYISPSVPRVVVGDPLRFRQIITNLISNAVKFTDQGEVLVNLDLENETDKLTYVKLTISDTGIGLTDVARKRLFQPFTQADGSTTRKYGGSGLGLAITKSLVELMGGEIGVDSVIGQGSKFWCLVPFEKSTWRETEDKRTLRVNLEGLRVLVVDDNPTHREIIRRYLDSWGMQGELAESARVALEMLNVANLKKESYDLAVLDYHMPDMDGMQLAQVIRENSEYKDLRLILLTAFDQRGQGDLALKEGFSAYLTKPVKQSLLFDTIANTVTAEGATSIPQEQSNEESSPSLESIKIGEKKTARILLAEDNLPNQMLTVAQLQKLGYEVDTVLNGLLALQKIITYSDRYQLILMDCQMPQMDGFAATREIRAYEANSEQHIPIIAMTANAMQGDREACLASGMDDYISKPVTIENLKSMIEFWLQGRAPKGAGENNMEDTLKSALDQSIVDGIRELQMEGEPDFLTELIDIYMVDAPKLFDKIRVG